MVVEYEIKFNEILLYTCIYFEEVMVGVYKVLVRFT